jgi:F0F1-type ATP synthase assembly protein I
LLGILTGMYIDEKFNSYPVFSIFFTFLGILAGYRIAWQKKNM